MTDDVTAHYASDGIARKLLDRLRAVQGEVPVTPDALAPMDHFHGRGLAATREVADMLAPLADERLLDIGCGIGGPARWLAAQFGCHVTGIDLTPDFCAAARALTDACGLAGRVDIQQGSATALPFPDQAFDAALSQNVVMNIPDKSAVWREAHRVLKPGGRLAVTCVCAGPGGPAHYPQPWAESAATSFLVPPAEIVAGLERTGFTVATVRETTEAIRSDRARQQGGPLPPLGLHVFLGEDRLRRFMANGLRSMQEGRSVTLALLASRA